MDNARAFLLAVSRGEVTDDSIIRKVPNGNSCTELSCRSHIIGHSVPQTAATLNSRLPPTAFSLRGEVYKVIAALRERVQHPPAEVTPGIINLPVDAAEPVVGDIPLEALPLGDVSGSDSAGAWQHLPLSELMLIQTDLLQPIISSSRTADVLEDTSNLPNINSKLFDTIVMAFIDSDFDKTEFIDMVSKDVAAMQPSPAGRPGPLTISSMFWQL